LRLSPFVVLFTLALLSAGALAEPLPDVPDEPWAAPRPAPLTAPPAEPRSESRLTLALDSDVHFPTDESVATNDVRLVQLHLGWRRGVRFERGIHVSGGAMLRVTALSMTSESVDFGAQDTGSHLDVSYHPFADPDDGLELTIFPFDANPLRLGWTYPASVGGRDFLGREDWVGAPGARLELSLGPWFVFTGVKLFPVIVELGESANEQGTTIQESETELLPAAFAGTGVDLLGEHLRLEAGFGYIKQREITLDNNEGSTVETIDVIGGSWRVAVRHQSPMDGPLDRALLSGDPNLAFEELRPVLLGPGDLGVLFVVEGVHLVQRLADPGLRGDMTEQEAMALVARQRVRVRRFRFELAQSLRTLPFLLAGPTPLTAFDDAADLTNELYLSVTADYRFQRVPLTLGLSGSARLPAMWTTELYGKTGPNATPTLIGEGRIIIRPDGERLILPEGEDRVPAFRLRLHGRFDVKEQFIIHAWAAYGYDGNQAYLELNADLTKTRRIAEDHLFSFGTSIAWRF
jgi:hypothetical protein